jgi:hypothetical protein
MDEYTVKETGQSVKLSHMLGRIVTYIIHHWRVAQLVEHPAVNRTRIGSKPISPARTWSEITTRAVKCCRKQLQQAGLRPAFMLC